MPSRNNWKGRLAIQPAPDPRRNAMCGVGKDRKRRHVSAHAAKKFLGKCIDMEPYECPYCGWWHVGHTPGLRVYQREVFASIEEWENEGGAVVRGTNLGMRKLRPQVREGNYEEVFR